MNYYELFDIAASPIIDKNTVTKKFIELQKSFHPDFFSNENEQQKDDALEKSAAINKAYSIFTDNDKSLEYYLQQNNAIVADEKFALPQDFLMAMMDLNEEPEEERMKKAMAFENDLASSVAHLLSANATEALPETSLQQLKLFYYQKKYLKRILDRLDD